MERTDLEHKKEAPMQLGCMVITVSDTRSEETDQSGKLMIALLQEHGHTIPLYRIVPDEGDRIRAAIEEGANHPAVDAILLNGGTGISPRDTTYEVVESLLEKTLPGFGELFRYLSYAEAIGPAAMLTRAIAGVARKKAIFSVPGSTGAVRMAMTRLILPELGHVIREIRKGQKK